MRKTKIKRLLSNLILLIIIVSICLIVLEAGLRIVHYDDMPAEQYKYIMHSKYNPFLAFRMVLRYLRGSRHGRGMLTHPESRFGLA